jgi:uncharacterized cupin superfamily protein
MAGSGEQPTWFVVNITEAATVRSPDFGTRVNFEPERGFFPQVGFKVQILDPGQPNCYYHRETSQEGCLVLTGQCTALIEDQEIALNPGDFVYLGPGTTHVFVGSGEGTCVIALFGARQPRPKITYPVSARARSLGAGVKEETDDPRQAYAQLAGWQPGTPPGQIPW